MVGAAGWEEQLEANKRAFADEWVTRPAFREIYDGLTDADYVDRLFTNAGVTPAQAERDALVSGLADGSQTRAGVLRRVAENTEFVKNEINPAFVMMQYLGYLRRDPDESGYNFWLNKLNRFNGNFVEAEMIKAFIISQEYRERFGAQ